jgi:hypothetical protein
MSMAGEDYAKSSAVAFPVLFSYSPIMAGSKAIAYFESGTSFVMIVLQYGAVSQDAKFICPI